MSRGPLVVLTDCGHVTVPWDWDILGYQHTLTTIRGTHIVLGT
jgi:hypothetical protein